MEDVTVGIFMSKTGDDQPLALPFTHILAHTISTHPPATEKIPCTLAAACCTPAR